MDTMTRSLVEISVQYKRQRNRNLVKRLVFLIIPPAIGCLLISYNILFWVVPAVFILFILALTYGVKNRHFIFEYAVWFVSTCAFVATTAACVTSSSPHWYNALLEYFAGKDILKVAWWLIVPGVFIQLSVMLYIMHRCAERARDILETLPEQQMAIDGKISQHLISIEEAQGQRERILQRCAYANALSDYAALSMRSVLLCVIVLWPSVAPRWEMGHWIWLMTLLPLLIAAMGCMLKRNLVI